MDAHPKVTHDLIPNSQLCNKGSELSLASNQKISTIALLPLSKEGRRVIVLADVIRIIILYEKIFH